MLGKLQIVACRGYWTPVADVYESREEIEILLEVAGADPEKLDILLYEDALVVTGYRELKQPPKKGKYHLAEIRQGPFCFQLPLSEVIYPDQIESHYADGMLTIRINKSVGKHGT